MKTNLRISLILPVLLSLGGCFTNAKYDCPAPNGVACMSARQIYDATEDTDSVQKKTADKPVRATLGKDVAIVDNELTLSGEPRPPAVDVIPEDLPVRMPAKILRVWVNAWEDEGNNLHSASTLYTEITPRRWTMGAPAPQLAPRLELLQPLDAAPGDSSTQPARTERTVTPNQDGTHVPATRKTP